MAQSRKAVEGISVVMPVRNAGQFLSHAVASIVAQDYQHWELIIVDDHSNDDSLEQVDDDPRVQVVPARARGLVNALNQGVAQANFPLIARMDGDDIASPNRLSEQYRYWIENPNVDIVGGKVKLFRDDGPLGQGYTLYEEWINSACEPTQIAQQFFVESPIAHPTALFSKEIFDRLGGYQDHGWPEDYDLWCRAFIGGASFGKPDTAPLLHWRDHNSRTSRTNHNYSKEAFLKCKARYLAQHLKQTASEHTYSIWGAGPTGLKLHDHLKDNGVSVSHFYDVNPKLAGTKKRGKPVIVLNEKSHFEAPGARSVCLVAVSSRGARTNIETFMKAHNRSNGRDFILAA